MAINLSLDTVLSRVQIQGTVLGAGTALFERSTNNLTWTTVRGGEAITTVGGIAAVDDYEFNPNVVNYYRVTRGATTFTGTITPTQNAIWMKSISRPFLNRPITVVDHSDITREARNGIFPVIGRSNPVAVTDVRLAREFTLTVKAETVSDADAIEVVLAGGDPLYIQVPPDGKDIPGGYVAVGTMTRRRYGHHSARRWFDLPCTTVAPPGPGVVGATNTWAALVAGYGTWADVLAAFGTWQAVADYVASPTVVIVP